LLLFGQLASSALQLCLEEDGSLVVELAASNCGEKHAEHSPESSSFGDGGSDPCLDSRFCLNLHQASSRGFDVTPLLVKVTAPNDHGLTTTAAQCMGYGWNFWIDHRGALTSPWLEHQDLLAKLHDLHSVVMHC